MKVNGLLAAKRGEANLIPLAAKTVGTPLLITLTITTILSFFSVAWIMFLKIPILLLKL